MVASIVLISSSKNESERGEGVSNGGYKVYNLWASLLRENGYPSFIVTHDGKYTPWLHRHVPHISMEVVQGMVTSNLPVIFVTGWLDSSEFLNLAEKNGGFYYYDCEVSYTMNNFRYAFDSYLHANQVRKIATNSVQSRAWYSLNYPELGVDILPEWSNGIIWFSVPEPLSGSAPVNVGYMTESSDTQQEICVISDFCNKRAFRKVNFVQISGDEMAVIAAMKQCHIFLGMNHGKSVLGEGCPRSQQEALHLGCALVSFDVSGNRMYLVDGHNGYLVKVGDVASMAEKLADLVDSGPTLQRFRLNSRELARSFTQFGRLEYIRKFLDLPEVTAATFPKSPDQINRDDLEDNLGASAYIGRSEIRYLCNAAARIYPPDLVVEIGAAFGASSALLLMASKSQVISIDPFVQDSEGEFTATALGCYTGVEKCLNKFGAAPRFGSWKLLPYYSHDLAVLDSVADGTVGLLYVDGSHLYADVRRDFDLWLPKVRDGGIIILHDSCRPSSATCPHEFDHGWEGPTKVAEELRSDKRVSFVSSEFSMTEWRKESNSENSN